MVLALFFVQIAWRTEDIAAAYLFLASKDASFINGTDPEC
jgi:NAD(P)-dependent dehydrogenase (short-subunit alcohol dehydrogenase family)